MVVQTLRPCNCSPPCAHSSTGVRLVASQYIVHAAFSGIRMVRVSILEDLDIAFLAHSGGLIVVSSELYLLESIGLAVVAHLLEAV